MEMENGVKYGILCFWRFVLKHKDFFKKPRTNMLTFSLNRMSQDKRDSYVKTAEIFLKNL